MTEQLETELAARERHPVIEGLKRNLREKVAHARVALADYETAIAAEPDNDGRINEAGERFSILAGEISLMVRNYRLVRDVQGFG